MTQITDDERGARAALTYLAEPGERKLNALISACGAQAALDAIGRRQLPSLTHPEADRADLERWHSRLGAVPSGSLPERFAADGIRVICPGDPEWPRRLYDMAGESPYALWAHGSADLARSCETALSVTGIRPASDPALDLAYSAAAEAAARSRAVISGAASGTDTAAHQGALDSGGQTIAVLPCGLGRPHPPQYERLSIRAAEAGAAVSEIPPGHLASRDRFARRCEILAAMAASAVVIGAQPDTPEFAAASAARRLRRNLMDVPADPDPRTWAARIGQWMPGTPSGEASRRRPAPGAPGLLGRPGPRPARASRGTGPGNTRRGRR